MKITLEFNLDSKTYLIIQKLASRKNKTPKQFMVDSCKQYLTNLPQQIVMAREFMFALKTIRSVSNNIANSMKISLEAVNQLNKLNIFKEGFVENIVEVSLRTKPQTGIV